MKPGDKVIWNPLHPDVETLRVDFGLGPFRVRDVEGLMLLGQWVSLITEADGFVWNGFAWVDCCDPTSDPNLLGTMFPSDWLAPWMDK